MYYFLIPFSHLAVSSHSILQSSLAYTAYAVVHQRKVWRLCMKLPFVFCGDYGFSMHWSQGFLVFVVLCSYNLTEFTFCLCVSSAKYLNIGVSLPIIWYIIYKATNCFCISFNKCAVSVLQSIEYNSWTFANFSYNT